MTTIIGGIFAAIAVVVMALCIVARNSASYDDPTGKENVSE